MSEYTICLKQQPLKHNGLHNWCLDFPRDKDKASAAELGDTGLIFQGWVLVNEPALTKVYLQQADSRTDIPLDRNRPDVIKAILQHNPENHPLLSCGFRLNIPLIHNEFILGITIEGTDHPLICGQVQGVFHVLHGKEGWLFLDNDTNKSVEQFTGKLLLERAERNNWKGYFKGLQQLAETLKIPLTMLMAPSKESVFQQFYPYARAKTTASEQLAELLPKGFPFVYPVAELAASSTRTFRVTDTHWSVHGACLATQLSAVSLGLNAADVASVFNTDAFYSKQMVGDLGNKVFPPARHAEDVLSSFSYRKQVVYDNQLPNFGRVIVARYAEALHDGHLLILGSSSAYSMLDYACRLFSCVTLIHTAGNVDTELVKQLKPDFLLTQTNARFIVRAPTLSYSLLESIAEKLDAIPLSVLAQQKVVVAASTLNATHPVPVLHTYYSRALQKLGK